MESKKLVVGVLFAATALAFILTNVLGGPAFLGDIDDLSAIALAATAFVVSWNQRSYLVAGLLIAGGIVFMIPAIIATEYFTVIVIPGPILGIISGLGVLGLGIVKGIRTARAPVTTTSALTGDFF
jgi:hypothetical protein